MAHPSPLVETVYVYGSCRYGCAGVGISYGFEDERNESIKLVGTQTSNRAEIAALIAVARTARIHSVWFAANVIQMGESALWQCAKRRGGLSGAQCELGLSV
jgi:hypothetical protein